MLRPVPAERVIIGELAVGFRKRSAIVEHAIDWLAPWTCHGMDRQTCVAGARAP
jgi:hypothetical protein